MTRLIFRRVSAPWSIAIAFFALATSTQSAQASITAIGPFVGDYTDTFNQYSNTMAVLSLPVFQNHGAINMISPGGAIKVEFSSQLGNDLVVPISGMMMGQLGIADWVFNEPTLRFGGMWENNSGASDANLQFFDAQNNLLGTAVANVPVAAQTWTWNGWHSDIPFTRVRVTGNGLVNGFIWYENMQLDVVPEPAAAGLMLGSALLLIRRSRPRRR